MVNRDLRPPGDSEAQLDKLSSVLDFAVSLGKWQNLVGLLRDPKCNLCDHMPFGLMPRGEFLSCILKAPGGGEEFSMPAK